MSVGQHRQEEGTSFSAEELNQAPVGILRLDQHGRITFANARLIELLGNESLVRVGDAAPEWSRGKSLHFMAGGQKLRSYSSQGQDGCSITWVLESDSRGKEHPLQLTSSGASVGKVAHDLNNMLTAIFSFTNFAMESLDEDDPAGADLQEVLDAAKQAEFLNRQLLTIPATSKE